MKSQRNKIRIAATLALLALAIILFSFISSAQSAYGEPIKKEAYEVSRSKIEREITYGSLFRDSFIITNPRDGQLRVTAVASPDISALIELDSSGIIVDAKNSTEIYFNIVARELGNYAGEIVLSGDVSERLPVNISVINESSSLEFIASVETTKKVFVFEDNLGFIVKVQKLFGTEIENITLSYNIKKIGENSSHFISNETINLKGSSQIRKTFPFPEGLSEGFYILEITAEYKNREALSSTEFQLKKPFWSITLFGFLPLWLLALIIGILIVGITTFIFIERAIEKSKKYKMQLYTKTLPKKEERSLWLGRIAETKMPAYLDMDALTTHIVVAGATGGGKSIAAQTFIEELLLKNISVIVFDPTAQWSGMLRKCEDKKMLSFYPKFGLKPNDAKAFPGNVRQIQNERQAIDIKKYINPGQIQIFTMNKLTPPQIDTFVASVISSIFKSDPKEHPELRTMLVFDEVHRLLPKFGGSGKGFLQIERACREFRKWGFGVMLVSQVLSDFVGEIKANINTEVQMRTRDESDLNRLKTKYGEEFLQSLIKASVGVGMFVNPRYNKGKPYFINFRPILHNTRRLSDEVLEKYNKYGEEIEDLEYQIEQLEQEKVDTFDLKMELKLVKDKLMTGNFTVVDIYLEGLKPRIEKQWSSLGKKPKKRELELVAKEDVEASLKQAQKGRENFEKKEGESPSDKKESSKPEETPKTEESSKTEEPPKPKEQKEKVPAPVEKKETPKTESTPKEKKTPEKTVDKPKQPKPSPEKKVKDEKPKK